MTKTSRRATALLAPLAVWTAAGAACVPLGRPGPAGSSGSSEAKPMGSGSAPAGKLSFWAINANWGWMSQGTGGDLMAALRARHPQLEIEVADVVPGGPASVEKLHTAAAAGTMPDLYMANRGYAAQLGAEGISRPLDEFVRRSSTLPRDDLWESHLQDASWKGQLFSITHSSGVWVLYLNRQLWLEAGLDVERPPKTWDALEDAARRTASLAGGTPERLGYHPTLGGAGTRFWLVHLRQMGSDYFTRDWQPAFVGDDRAVRVLSWMKGFIDRQGGWEAVEEFRQQAQAGLSGGIFGSGRIGAITETHTQIPVLQNAASPVSFTVAALPLPPGGTQSGWQGGADLHIARRTGAVEAAWAVVEHLMAPANVLQFSLALSRIPSRKSVGQSAEYLSTSPHHRVFVEMVSHSHNVPAVPGNLELEPIISAVANQVLSGQKGIRDALEAAAQQTRVVMEKWRPHLT